MTNIPALPKELLSLIRQGEDYKIEYKEATNKISKNLYDTVSSFSNREGGDVFLGVHDCCVIMGVDEAAINSLISIFVTAVNNEDIISPALYLTAQAYYYDSDGTFSAVDSNGRTITEQAGRHYILHIHVPVSPNVIRHSSKIYDRNGDSDVDITKHSDLVFQCYARKQSTFDSYDRMFDFGQKHLNDEFVLDGIVSVSARNAILREIISDTLSHRDYSSHYIARMVITKDAITVENGNRAHGMGMLNLNFR